MKRPLYFSLREHGVGVCHRAATDRGQPIVVDDQIYFATGLKVLYSYKVM
jgi:hypothetical protein